MDLLKIEHYKDSLYVKAVAKILWTEEELTTRRIEDACAPDRSKQSLRTPFEQDDKVNQDKIDLIKSKLIFFLFNFNFLIKFLIFCLTKLPTELKCQFQTKNGTISG